MNIAIVFDTETTGIDDPRIVEAAYLEIKTDMTMGPMFCKRYNPGKPVELGAMAAHHIMDEDLAACTPYTDFKLPPDVGYIIGYNVDYDWKAIGSPDVKRICVLALCRMLWPELDSHTQSAMLYHLNRGKARELLKEAHSAENDVMNCARILWRVMQMLEPQEKESWEALWRTSELARVPTVMSFGKHKGMAIRDLPADYKQWMLKQADIDPYLVKALKGQVS